MPSAGCALPAAPGCREPYPGLGWGSFFGSELSAFSNWPSRVDKETQIHMKQISNILQLHRTDFIPLLPQPIVLNLNIASHRAEGKNAASSNSSLTTDPRVTSPGHRVSWGQGLPLLWPHQTRSAWTSAVLFTPAQQRLLQLTQQDVPARGGGREPRCTLHRTNPAAASRTPQTFAITPKFCKIKNKIKKKSRRGNCISSSGGLPGGKGIF